MKILQNGNEQYCQVCKAEIENYGLYLYNKFQQSLFYWAKDQKERSLKLKWLQIVNIQRHIVSEV